MEEKKGLKESQKLRVEFVSTVVLMFIASAVTVLAALSWAWFASNQQVSTADNSVTVDSDLFELGFDKKYMLSNAWGSSILNYFRLPMGYSYNERDEEPNIVTAGDNTGIICALQTDDGEALRPGSTGYMTFKIIPKKADLIFNVSPVVSGLRPITVTDPDTNVKSTSYKLVSPGAEDLSDDEERAAALVQGHILFFADAGHTQQVKSGEPFVVDDATTIGEHTYTLYWVWARTYEDLREELLGCLGTDAAVNDELETNTELYFSGQKTEISEGVHEYVDPTKDLLNGNGYNNGDQCIGDCFYYVVVELSVSAVQTEQ